MQTIEPQTTPIEISDPNNQNGSRDSIYAGQPARAAPVDLIHVRARGSRGHAGHKMSGKR